MGMTGVKMGMTGRQMGMTGVRDPALGALTLSIFTTLKTPSRPSDRLWNNLPFLDHVGLDLPDKARAVVR
jgi:hypothetical protein